jgi:hypothetical protein
MTLLDNLPFFIASFIVPVLFWGINGVVRGWRQMFQSGGADFILGILAFDAGVLLNAEAFQSFVKCNTIATAIVSVFFSFFLVGLLVWLFAVVFVEKQIQVCTNGPSTVGQKCAVWFFWFPLTWTFVLTILHLNLMPFLPLKLSLLSTTGMCQ